MGYVNAKAPKVLYHLTSKKNLNSILESKAIKRFGDTECWFCESLENMRTYMEYTVLQEGKPYIDKDGSIKRYPRFEAEDHVILKLIPRNRQDRWVRWMQEVSANASDTVKAQAREFSESKIGYRGDLRFSAYEVLSVGEAFTSEFSKNNQESRVFEQSM